MDLSCYLAFYKVPPTLINNNKLSINGTFIKGVANEKTLEVNEVIFYLSLTTAPTVSS